MTDQELDQMLRRALLDAAAQAVDFIRLCAVRTAAEGIPLREGVDFEPLLGHLVPRTE